MSRIIRKIRKNKDETKKKLNKVKSTTLKLSLIMLNFIFATFAWFTYTLILDSNVDVDVSAWQVDFKDGNGILDTAINLELDAGMFYPGMDDFVKELEIENLGERAASITYQIDELKILGDTYEVKKTRSATDSVNTVYASESIDEETGMNVVKILNDSTKYPFEIILTHTPELGIINPDDPDQNKGSFEIRFTWPFEITGTETQINTKNSLDTKWGHDIANFYKEQEEAAIEQVEVDGGAVDQDENPAEGGETEQEEENSTEQGIEIILKVVAKQII